jgi:ectoine hydroxylase
MMDALVDLYPSRQDPIPSISPRRDPVVHGAASAADGLLDETLERYRQDGFIFFDSFLDRDSVVDLSAEMNRLREEAAGDDLSVIREPSSQTIRSIFEAHKKSSAVNQLIRYPRLLGPVRQILGGPVYVHQSRINYKSGFDSAPFYWHSDFETWHNEDGMPRMRAVSVQISLTENSSLTGPLMLIPGSHLHYVSCVGEAQEALYTIPLRRQDQGVPDRASLSALMKEGGVVSPMGPAGSMVLFDCNSIHGSNSNIMPRPSSELVIVFNSVDNRLTQPFGGGKPRPSFLAEREGEELV